MANAPEGRSNPRVRAPNIRDVAALAGVSYQTVSRVLNGSERLRPATRERVLAAIDELGFRPNQAARALVTSRSRTIGVLSSQSDHFGPTTSLNAIEASARAAGYRLSVTSIEDGASASIRAALDYLLSQSVEALVVIAPQRRVLDALTALSISVPFVTLESTGRDPEHGLSIDQVSGARMAVRHLVELGHRDILHISGPQDWIEAEARARGYSLELTASGLRPRAPIVGDWTAAFGYGAGRSLLSGSAARDFTAVFCGNDQMALGFMHACREAGLEVPGDLSVVGFDDTPESAHFAPPLTTVRQDFAEIGRRAIERLLGELAGASAVPEAAEITPELIMRESTAVHP